MFKLLTKHVEHLHKHIVRRFARSCQIRGACCLAGLARAGCGGLSWFEEFKRRLNLSCLRARRQKLLRGALIARDRQSSQTDVNSYHVSPVSLELGLALLPLLLHWHLPNTSRCRNAVVPIRLDSIHKKEYRGSVVEISRGQDVVEKAACVAETNFSTLATSRMCCQALFALWVCVVRLSKSRQTPAGRIFTTSRHSACHSRIIVI